MCSCVAILYNGCVVARVWVCGCVVRELLCALAPHVLNRELADIMHVTSQPIKPLLTGAPLSEIFHRSECEISRIRWKLQQLYIQRLKRAPNSSHLNQPRQVTRLTCFKVWQLWPDLQLLNCLNSYIQAMEADNICLVPIIESRSRSHPALPDAGILLYLCDHLALCTVHIQ